MSKRGLSPNGAEIVDALTESHDTLKEGGAEAVAKRYTVRTVKLDLDPRCYTGEDVRKVRELLGLSQALFARFLGVSVNAVRSWENGGKKPSNMACRFLDEISLRPDVFQARVKEALVSKAKGEEPSGCNS